MILGHGPDIIVAAGLAIGLLAGATSCSGQVTRDNGSGVDSTGGGAGIGGGAGEAAPECTVACEGSWHCGEPFANSCADTCSSRDASCRDRHNAFLLCLSQHNSVTSCFWDQSCFYLADEYLECAEKRVTTTDCDGCYCMSELEAGHSLVADCAPGTGTCVCIYDDESLGTCTNESPSCSTGLAMHCCTQMVVLLQP
jgi:hypothetical protein